MRDWWGTTLELPNVDCEEYVEYMADEIDESENALAVGVSTWSKGIFWKKSPEGQLRDNPSTV